jgi:hypothetical protein
MNLFVVFPFRLRVWIVGGLGVLATFAFEACQLTEVALVAPPGVDAAAQDTALFAPDVRVSSPDVATFESQPITSLAGQPQIAGCADGTREGFVSAAFAFWPNIAGCSGAWDQPGLSIEAIRKPSCGRMAGNTGLEPTGIGCGAADLCANGWHVCLGPREVERHSPSQCESVVAPGVAAFFAVAGGGGTAGDCAAGQFGSMWLDDIRGCGTIGHAEGNGCYPLDRRLEFSDCLATKGAWACGGAATHDQEVKLVVKPNTELGGVLCCRDES